MGCIKTSHSSLARISVTVKIQFIHHLERIKMEKPNALPMPPGPDEQPPSYEASIQHMPPYPTQGMPPASSNVKGTAPTTSYIEPGLQAGAWQHPAVSPPIQPGYQPPPGQYQQQPQRVVVVQLPSPNFGPNPIEMMCPHCQSQVRTSTESEPGALAWILAGILCVVGLWPCACVPCCIDSLNSVTHKCPNCRQFLGRYRGGM